MLVGMLFVMHLEQTGAIIMPKMDDKTKLAVELDHLTGKVGHVTHEAIYLLGTARMACNKLEDSAYKSIIDERLDAVIMMLVHLKDGVSKNV